MIVIFSEGRYRKRQSTCYCADEKEFANHLVSLCGFVTSAQRTCGVALVGTDPLHNSRTTGFDPKPFLGLGAR